MARSQRPHASSQPEETPDGKPGTQEYQRIQEIMTEIDARVHRLALHASQLASKTENAHPSTARATQDLKRLTQHCVVTAHQLNHRLSMLPDLLTPDEGT